MTRKVRLDEMYAAAAEATGKTVDELKAMAPLIFGTMLHHALLNKGKAIWSYTRIGVEPWKLEVEVNASRK